MRALVLAVAALLAGCAAFGHDPHLATGTPIVLQPQATAQDRLPAKLSTAVAAKQATTHATERVLSDTAATQARGACFVAAPGTSPDAIDKTTSLTLATKRATARLRSNHSKAGYRPADIAAARLAADALANHLPDGAPCPAPETLVPPEGLRLSPQI